MMFDNTVIVLPATEWQIPLVKKLKTRGYHVIALDLYENQPSYIFADEHRIVDIIDREACLDIAVRSGAIAAITDECDIAIPTVAYINSCLGAANITEDLACLYTNKFRMREFSTLNGFPVPYFRHVFSINDALDAYDSFNGKMIMKPVDSNSSRGVCCINNKKDIIDNFVNTESFSIHERGVIIEEYVEGPEFTVDGIVVNHKHFSLAISQKKHFLHHPNIACSLWFSHKNPQFDYDILRRQNDDYIQATGLPFGLTHAEYKYNGREFIMIEVGARGGGNYISSHIVPAMSGLDIYDILIDQMLGNNPDLCLTNDINDSLANKCCLLHFFDFPITCNGKRVNRVQNIDLLDDPHVLSYGFHFNPGDVLNTAKDDSQRVGYYIAYANNEKELSEYTRMIDEKVKIEFEVAYG